MIKPARVLQEGLRAAVPAMILSGVPSTSYALLTGDDVLEASRAAGSAILPRERRTSRLLVAAVPVHILVSLGWAIALAVVLPRRRPVREGITAGLAIAAIDLGLVGRRYPRIRALRTLPQLADHIAFGTITAVSLSRRGDGRS